VETMHAEPKLAITAVALLAFLSGLGLLSVLFLFRKSRPLGWIILCLIVAGVGVVVSYSSRAHHRPVAPLAYKHIYYGYTEPAEHWDAHALEHLQGSRIQLDLEATVVEESAHAAAPPHPLEATDALTSESDAVEDVPAEAAPLESDASEGSHPADTHFHADEAPAEASPSDSVGTVESTPSPREDGSRAPTTVDRQRPPWLEDAFRRSGNSFQFVVRTGQYPTREEADREVNRQIVIKTAEVLGDLVGRPLIHDPHAYQQGTSSEWVHEIALHHLLRLELTPGAVRSAVWRDEYVQSNEMEFDKADPLPMVEIYTLLEYDPAFQAELQERWRRSEARQRIGAIGVIAAGVLGLLGITWGVLKFDTMTKGYYTKRLLIGGAALGAVAAG
jgi:hypothetical protein